MAEQNNNAIREIPKHDVHVEASTQDRSLIKDLAKGAMEEVIIPKSRDAMRNMSDEIFNMVIESLRRLRDGFLYPNGDAPNRRSTPGNGIQIYEGQTNYTSFSTPISTYQPSNTPVRDPIGQRPGNEVKYIWVATEDKADKLVNTLKNDINHYGFVKVASLYEMTGTRTTMADFRYGWTRNEINNIRYYYDTNRKPNEFKWFIDLPRPVDIRNV